MNLTRGEIFRHELNNELTGILGNAELLLVGRDRLQLYVNGQLQFLVQDQNLNQKTGAETYGPGDFRLLKLFRALERGRFIIVGSGQNRRQAIHVRDLVQGLLLAATHPAALGETFVLAGQETMTTREMVEYVARSLGRSAPRWHVPMWPFLAAAVVMEKTLSPNFSRIAA